MKFAIVGFGSRGQMFGRLIKNSEHELVAVAEPIPHSLERAYKEFGVSKDMCFNDANDFFAKGKICDAIFLCTQDAQHYEMTMKALELGYDICLEKPAAVNYEQCVAIRDEANRLNRKIMLTHVLRYSPFYQCIKETIKSGVLGKIININQNEFIAYWHFALSFVRGPWRNMADSTPTIVAKCCHDLDILLWLMDKECVSVASVGRLNYFCPENAPKGSANHCKDCSKEVKDNCLYNAYNIYPQRMKHAVVGGVAKYAGKNIYDVLDAKEELISKCIFHCDNDAIDNQNVQLQFADGTLANLTMTAFSEECHRTIMVSGTKGEMWGDMEDGKLHLNIFGQDEVIIDAGKRFNKSGVATSGGHGGGDFYLFNDFVDYIKNENSQSLTRTTINQSIDSHLVGFLAEESRQKNGERMFIKR